MICSTHIFWVLLPLWPRNGEWFIHNCNPTFSMDAILHVWIFVVYFTLALNGGISVCELGTIWLWSNLELAWKDCGKLWKTCKDRHFWIKIWTQAIPNRKICYPLITKLEWYSVLCSQTSKLATTVGSDWNLGKQDEQICCSVFKNHYREPEH